MEGIKRDVDNLKQACLEHKIRLENGIDVFTGIRHRIDALESIVIPKPTSTAKVVGITFSIALAAATSLWGLANTLRDRPTLHQIDTIIQAHDKSGHPEMRTQLDSIRAEQKVQKETLDEVKKEVKSQGAKLDSLLQRRSR